MWCDKTHDVITYDVITYDVITNDAITDGENDRRNEDGVRWTEALEALKGATQQLKALEEEGVTEEAIAEDPRSFFAKVC